MDGFIKERSYRLLVYSSGSCQSNELMLIIQTFSICQIFVYSFYDIEIQSMMSRFRTAARDPVLKSILRAHITDNIKKREPNEDLLDAY